MLPVGYRSVWVSPVVARAQHDNADRESTYPALFDLVLDGLFNKTKIEQLESVKRGGAAVGKEKRVDATQRSVMRFDHHGLRIAGLTGTAHKDNYHKTIQWGDRRRPGLHVLFVREEDRISWFNSHRDLDPHLGPLTGSCLMALVSATAQDTDAGDPAVGGKSLHALTPGTAVGVYWDDACGNKVDVSVECCAEALPGFITAADVVKYVGGSLALALKRADGSAALLGADAHYVEETGNNRYLWLGKLGARLPAKEESDDGTAKEGAGGAGGAGGSGKEDEDSRKDDGHVSDDNEFLCGGSVELCGEFSEFLKLVAGPWSALGGDAAKRAATLHAAVRRRTDWAAQAGYVSLSILVLRAASAHVCAAARMP